MWNSIWIFIYFHCTVGVYQIFKERKTWNEGQRYCQLGDGKLAHLYSMSSLPPSFRGSNIGFWVGGHLHDQGFYWKTSKDNMDNGIPLEPLAHHKGCYKPAHIYGGHALEKPSAVACFAQCQWKGTIGLKSHYCLCDDNLREVTRTEDSHCDVNCSGSTSELCGGPKGVSMYDLNKKSVLWGVDEPNNDYECVYVKKQSNDEHFTWHTASCNMRMRYICNFEDHEACGVRKSCIRSPVQPGTWQDSLNGCRQVNGTTAFVDIAMMYDKQENTKQIPPGEYWIGLRRNRRWEWKNGLPISASLFHQRTNSFGDEKCIALTYEDNSLNLATATCTERKPFICQYDIRNKILTTTRSNNNSFDSTTKEFLRSQNMDMKQKSDIDEAEILMTISRNTSSSKEKELTDDNRYDYQNDLYKSIMYLAIGVAAGMGLVFSICVIVYVGKRCKSRTTQFKTVRYPKGQNPVLRYANDAPSNHATSEPEVLYEIPCDAQESPFRTTQRILQQNYAINRDGFPSNSWRRKKSDRDHNNYSRNQQPEIRNIYPYSERSYGDTSYIIHNVRAQCHPNENRPSANQPGHPIDITYTGSLDTRLRRPPSQNQQSNDVRLSETYSLPEQGRKMSEPILHVDTSDLYACVQKAMQNVDDDYYDNSDQNIRVTVC